MRNRAFYQGAVAGQRRAAQLAGSYNGEFGAGLVTSTWENVMSRIAIWIASLFLLMPILAHAETIPINAQATGLIAPDEVWLRHLVGENVPPGTDPVQFALTIETSYDTEQPGFFELNSPPSARAAQPGRPGILTFSFGDYTHTYNGTAFLEALLNPNLYKFTFTFTPASYHLYVSLIFRSPPGGLSGDPLATRMISTDNGFSAEYAFESFSANPESSGYWFTADSLSSATLNVASAVPEPGSLAMFFGGMLTLLIVARRRPARAWPSSIPAESVPN